MTDKKHIVKARVCETVVSVPLTKKEAERSAKEFKKHVPGAKVRVHETK